MDFTVSSKSVVLALQTFVFLVSSYKNSLCLSTDFENENSNRQHVKVENTDFEDLVDLPTNGEEISQLRLLKVGDHIATPGHSNKIQYFHHGIYLGLEKGVADFGFDGENKSDAKPRVIDLMEFINGRLFRINYPSTQCLPPDETVRKAEDLVQNPLKWKSYDLFRNNCEHFATYCKTGRAVSTQVTQRITDLDNLPINGEEIAQLRLLKVGDHIATPGHSTKIQYFHHGIYLGLEKGVVDFGFDGENKSAAKPRVIDLMEFINGRLFRINYPSTQCLPPDETVRKAENLVKKPSKWKSYDLLRNNCEHFATYCKTGMAVSKQVTMLTCIRDTLKRLYEEAQKFVKKSSGSSSFNSGSLAQKSVKKSSGSSSFNSGSLQNQWASTYMSVQL